MITTNETVCPCCGGHLLYYDTVPRIALTKRRTKNHLKLRRLRCVKCNAIHREILDDILPYKQYEAEVIRGVLEGFITSDTLGFEDYPNEMTMSRWKLQKCHLMSNSI